MLIGEHFALPNRVSENHAYDDRHTGATSSFSAHQYLINSRFHVSDGQNHRLLHRVVVPTSRGLATGPNHGAANHADINARTQTIVDDDTDNQPNDGRSASRTLNAAMTLIDCVVSGDLRRCESFLRNGHSPESRDDLERSALFLAALKGHRKVCELLILFGANVRGRSVNDASPLHAAAESGSVDCADLLVKRWVYSGARTGFNLHEFPTNLGI